MYIYIYTYELSYCLLRSGNSLKVQRDRIVSTGGLVEGLQ